ncbi:MAG: glycosyltransferase family 39 protein, partial [Lachnospiraceae bacterium]|nr:glycosyltransferase family 39 protein [Lachnospiraceae bacterium]
MASSWTSPLFKDAYGYDAAWYSTMGRAIVKGLTPYKDLFDLKGPVFFFYEALGELIIPGRGGIFLLQLISMAVTVIFLIKICRIYISRRLSYLTLILFFWPYVHLLWGGNTVEELFMPFNMAAIYLGLLYLNKTEEEAALSYEVKRAGLIYGIGAAVFALSKLTVGAPLFAMTLLILIVMIKEKRFISLKNSVIWFFLGVLIIAVPTFAYFMMRDALSDMIKAVFILGFKRSTDYYISFSSEWERQLLICPAAL